MNQKSFIIWLAILISIGLAACKKQPAPGPPAANPDSTASEPERYHHPEGGNTPPAETKHFKGSIGSTLGLQMKLTREGDQLSGNYFYQKIGSRIDLKGSIDKNGSVTLEEFDSTGKSTGFFRGLWKPDEEGAINISGSWSKPDGQRKTAFSVHEEPIAFSGSVDFVAKQIKENNKKLRYEIDVEYPQLTGSTDPNFEKFNQAVRGLALKEVGEFKKEMTSSDAVEPENEGPGSNLGIGYTIALAKDDLVSVLFDIGGYYSGAAHPNSHSQTLNFNLKSGKTIKLAELFNPGSKYLQTISSYCIKDLKRQSKGKDTMLDDASIESGAGPEGKNFESWTITKKGIGITFDAYQVGPYVAGPQYVVVPYAALKDIIKSDGALGQFVK